MLYQTEIPEISGDPSTDAKKGNSEATYIQKKVEELTERKECMRSRIILAKTKPLKTVRAWKEWKPLSKEVRRITPLEDEKPTLTSQRNVGRLKNQRFATGNPSKKTPLENSAHLSGAPRPRRPILSCSLRRHVAANVNEADENLRSWEAEKRGEFKREARQEDLQGEEKVLGRRGGEKPYAGRNREEFREGGGVRRGEKQKRGGRKQERMLKRKLVECGREGDREGN